ncbi:DUF305 domain-containing protein [Dankookia rubra]|uniref:DUF305 domain-containing protein n=1 Tax=Dankookia rubra TaxID=1442381 RepID=A0A4R5Q823_9PROT|nr:DUF305 domain-containing protein [Dankookia rubra]TDH58431.1 DUF305 domain-containing protein [Dankookia rubra]
MTTSPALLAAAAALALLAAPARAAIEDGYDPTTAPVPSTWYAPANPAALRADRDYVAGMRPHHAGALSMSRDYLADPAARSPVLKALAAGIIRNQSFEIGLLDEVARNLALPPRVLDLGIARIALQPAATEGMGQMQRFLRSPIPGPLGAAAGPVSRRDVQYAKAMIVHHEAALEMAHGYHADPAARNGFLGLMNTDIITDQSQEIALMRRVIAAYPGDAAAVPVDPGMVHGMEGMRHAAQGAPHAGAGHEAAPPAPRAEPAAAPKAHRHAAPRPRAQAAPQGHAGHAHHAME